MFCYKCGQELRADANYCDKCGASQNKKGKGLLIALIVAVFIIVFLAILLLIIINVKPAKKAENVELKEITVTNEPSVPVETKTEQEKTDKKEKKEEKKNVISSFFTGEAKLELPSFVSYSKERMSLGDYKEDKAAGGFVQYFEAGADTNVIQCIAEYKDMLAGYDFSLTGTLSSADGEWSYTAYLFTYNGDAGIEKGSINFEESGVCDMCIVTALGNGEGRIAAYVPEGVSFVESSEHMKNGY